MGKDNQLPEALRDKFEIVGTWPKGKFIVTGLEVAYIDIANMTERHATQLVKLGWKGIKAIQPKPAKSPAPAAPELKG